MRRSRGRVVLAAVFVLLMVNAWWQVIGDLAFGNASPRILTGWQALSGAAAAAAAWGSWTGKRWAPVIALLYGVITGAMIPSLMPILDLPAESRRGLWFGGTIIFLFGIWSAWWLARMLQRDRARDASHVVGFD